MLSTPGLVPIWLPEVTAANIGGTGTGIEQSSIIQLDLPTFAYTDCSIRVQFVFEHVSGTAPARGWLRLNAQNPEANGSPNIQPPAQFSHAIVASVVVLTRTITWKLTPITSTGFSNGEKPEVRVEGAGSAADTVWEIRDIKARIVATA